MSLQGNQDPVCSQVRCEFAGVDDDLRIFGDLVRVIDTRKALDDAGPRFCVQAFAVALLAHLDRRGYVNLEESADRFDHLADLAPGFRIRSDRCADGDAMVFRDLTRHEADALDIEVAVFAGKVQLAGQVFADHVPVQQGHGAPAVFKQLDHQGVGDG